MHSRKGSILLTYKQFWHSEIQLKTEVKIQIIRTNFSIFGPVYYKVPQATKIYASF